MTNKKTTRDVRLWRQSLRGEHSGENPRNEGNKNFGLTDMEDRVDYREAFPEYKGKENQTALRAYRLRERLTQVQLADLAGIPRRHISDMENGRSLLEKRMQKNWRMF